MPLFSPSVRDCGEVPLGCASTFDKYGCAYKAQEVNDSSDDVPRSVPSEESVTGTSSEDADAGESKYSGSNGEDAAPSSEEGDSEEGIVYHCPFLWTRSGARAAQLCGEMLYFL